MVSNIITYIKFILHLIRMHSYIIPGIEFMAAAQALDLRNLGNGAGVTTAKNVIRKYVDFLDVDRPLHTDHTRMKELVKSGEILEETEKEVGSLG